MLQKQKTTQKIIEKTDSSLTIRQEIRFNFTKGNALTRHASKTKYMFVL